MKQIQNLYYSYFKLQAYEKIIYCFGNGRIGSGHNDGKLGAQ